MDSTAGAQTFPAEGILAMAGQVGLLAAGSSYRPRLPGPSSGLCGVRPPFTVAGQRGNYTPFPFHPPVAEPNRNNRPF